MIELTPDYSRRREIIQPQFIRPRAAYRSPLRSEQWNLHAGQFRYDLVMLRARLERLHLDIEEALTQLLSEGVTAGGETIEEIGVLFAKIQQFEDRISALEAKKGL